MLHKYNYLLIRHISTTCNTDYSYNGYRTLQKIKNTNWIHHTKLARFNRSNAIYSQIRVHYTMGLWSQQKFDSLRTGPSRNRKPVGRYSLHPSKPGLGPTQRPAQWVAGLFPRESGRGTALITHPPSSANVKDRVPLLPSGPSWPDLWWPLSFTFNSYLIPRKVFFRPTQNNSIWNGIIQTEGLRLQVGYNTWRFSSHMLRQYHNWYSTINEHCPTN